jgi:hypothetical protein
MISSLGGSELKAVADSKVLQKLFDQKQKLIAEMNQAKREAADAAAKPYLEAIKEVDETYAFMLTFLGDNRKKD